MNFLQKINAKIAVASGLALSSAMTFAEGTTENYDFTAVTDNLTSLRDSLKTWMGNALPIILSVVGVFLVIWLAKIGIKAIKGLAKSGN